MKKTSEALSKAQDQAVIRRQLLESGKIRLIPQKPPVQQEKGRTKEVLQQDRK
jgi:hypothetical protein